MKKLYTGLSALVISIGLVMLVNAVSLTDMTDVPNEGGISQIKTSVNANYDIINANNALLNSAVSASTLTTNQTFLSVTGTTNTMVITNGVIYSIN